MDFFVTLVKGGAARYDIIHAMKYAVISDLHANLAALRKVLADAYANGAERIVCLGDVVGYGPLPAETLALARKSAAVIIAGNHDDAVSGRLDPSDFIDLAGDAVERHREQLPKEGLSWLRNLPYTASFDGAIAAHGDFTEPEAFNYVDSEESAAENFARTDAPLMFVGHTHTPCIYLTGASGRVYHLEPQDFVVEDGKRYIVNPGSVGYPRESNGTCLSSYAIYDSSARSVTFRTLPFAVSSVMQRGGLRHKSRALPFALAAFAAVALSAAALFLLTQGGQRLRTDDVAEEKAGPSADPAFRIAEKSLTLPTSAKKVRANLTLRRNSPPAQVELTFLAADGTPLSHASKPVKKSFREALGIPPGAVSARFAIFRLPGGGEPQIEKFAPAAF